MVSPLLLSGLTLWVNVQIQEYLVRGVDEVVTKPINREMLSSILAQYELIPSTPDYYATCSFCECALASEGCFVGRQNAE